MSKIILFNAPKNVGKTVAIAHLRSKGLNLISAECKQFLHHLTMTLFGVDPKRYWEIYNTRELKEVPLPDFRLNLICKEEVSSLKQALRGDFCVFDENRNPHIPISMCVVYCNLSIREAMIYVSEVIVKPRFGEDWFGQERVRKIKGYEDVVGSLSELVFADDSCAFVEELTPLIEHLGQENILLLRIHKDGHTFAGDSRDYIPDGVITNTVDIYNNGTEQEYLDKVETIVRDFLK